MLAVTVQECLTFFISVAEPRSDLDAMTGQRKESQDMTARSRSHHVPMIKSASRGQP